MTSPLIQAILNSPCGRLNPHLVSAPVKKKVVKARNDCPQVVAMHWWLKYWCEERGFEFEKELQFAARDENGKRRQFRFDFAVIAPTWKAGIEYHGLTKEKSGHTTTKGFTSDTEKMNLAISEGWKVYAYTFSTYQSVLTDLEKLII